MSFVDLSHTFEDGMPGFRFRNADGTFTQFTAHIRPFVTHEQSRPHYSGQAEFEITEMTFQTSIGTYLDSPYHRFRDRRDIGALRLEEVILPGVVIDVRHRQPFAAVGPQVLPEGVPLGGRAVLLNFGWDQHWGTEQYYTYPFIGRDLIERLVEAGVKLVGVDTLNIDDARDAVRPAHSEFLKRDILIVENLANLDALHGRPFRFFAVPLKAEDTAAMPVRAFAEV
jgi:kynurenine formamidase